MMPPFRMEETLKKYKESVTKKFCKTGFPVISNCIFVSGTTGENMEHKNTLLQTTAFSAILPTRVYFARFDPNSAILACMYFS